mmetsp:Transcript_36705/g.56269  ORF Transcript_36705/g.56269 Transcript_36705/m.56269 type:complete len:96 (+) Transcript_36705:750-1037(+)
MVLISIHHIQICIGTRNYTWVTVATYIFSYMCFIPITMLMNELTPGTSTYKSTFTDILGGSLIFWFSVLISMTIICIPMYLIKVNEMQFKAPEYY